MPTVKALALRTWAGLTLHRVQIIGETRTRYRVRLQSDARLPGGRFARAGDVVLVPRYAVRDVPERDDRLAPNR